MAKKTLRLVLIGGFMLAGLRADVRGEVNGLTVVGGGAALLGGLYGVWHYLTMPKSKEEATLQQAVLCVDMAKSMGKGMLIDGVFVDKSEVAMLSDKIFDAYLKARAPRYYKILACCAVTLVGGVALWTGLKNAK